MSRPPTIDNRTVSISYSKLEGDIGARSAASASYAAQPSAPPAPDTQDIPTLAEYYADLHATTPEEKAYYLEYYTDYYTQQQNASSQSDSANAAAAVAQSALQAVQSKSGSQKT